MPHTHSRKSADRLLVDQHMARLRAEMRTRACMCCRILFETDQDYRLCKDCREWQGQDVEPIPTIEEMLAQ